MRAVAAGLVVAVAACDDALDQRLAIIDQPRILAVVGEPAEARPGIEVAYRAIIATPLGPAASEPRWAFCLGSKPPTEDNAVSTSCVAGEQLVELGASAVASGPLPIDGCVRFGPDTPDPGFRPRDPDPTGGFYQPVRAEVDGLLAVGLSRITCKLGNAPADVARDYDVRYVANQNPTLLVAAVPPVRAFADVALTATWPEEAAETYLYYDQLSQTLVERRESLRVSWFATGGSIDVDATAVGERDPATSAGTTWHAPGTGPATLWFVLRDSRGGIATTTIDVAVE
jgi:hypothetical protein